MVQEISEHEPPEDLAARIQAWIESDQPLRLRRRVRRAFTWAAILEQQLEPLLAERVAARGRT